MTYRELRDALSDLDETQLDQQATVDVGGDFLMPVIAVDDHDSEADLTVLSTSE